MATVDRTIMSNMRRTTGSLCKRCNRRRVKPDQQYCPRCQVLNAREQEAKAVEEEKVMPVTMCSRCERRPAETGKTMCQRCLVLFERGLDEVLRGKENV